MPRLRHPNLAGSSAEDPAPVGDVRCPPIQDAPTTRTAQCPVAETLRRFKCSLLSSRKNQKPIIREHAIDALTSLNFTAIDLETANENRHSLCAIGIAKVRNGAVVHAWKQYVRPSELRMADINRSIHRIQEGDLKDAPMIVDIWDTFIEMLANEVVVAHNAEFDMDVLKQVAILHNRDQPTYRSLCTLKLSQVAFPELDDYRLDDVCRFLGLSFRHHNCDEDAKACAEIAIRAIPRVSINKLDLDGRDLTGKLAKVASRSKLSGWSAAFADKRMTRDLLQPELKGADPSHPFYAKRLVFTGDLSSMARAEAAERVKAFGADINTSISRKTQVVVMGAGAGPSKMTKILEFQRQGIDIWLVNEEEFLRLIG